MLILTDRQNYADIADAIRTRLGDDAAYLPSEMADAIMAIGNRKFTAQSDGAVARSNATSAVASAPLHHAGAISDFDARAMSERYSITASREAS